MYPYLMTISSNLLAPKKMNWKNKGKFVEIRSPWLTIIGEKLQDDQEQILDYWRVEKADSVVIITRQNHQFFLPIPMYRPGLGKTTLDFPGGRIPREKTPIEVVPDILKKELGLEELELINLTPLNNHAWAINSSFSNQKLYGFVAEIPPNISINPEKIGAKYPTTKEGINSLLEDLTCLQCRALLLEWLMVHYF